MIHRFILATCLFLVSANAREITVSGTRFLIDGKPFPYTGISFFGSAQEFAKCSIGG